MASFSGSLSSSSYINQSQSRPNHLLEETQGSLAANGARVPTRGSQACRTRDSHSGAHDRARHALRDPRRRASLHRDPKESDLPWCGENARAAGSLKCAAGRFRFRFPVPVARETERGRAGSCARCRAGLGSRVYAPRAPRESGFLWTALHDSWPALLVLWPLPSFLKAGLLQRLPSGGVHLTPIPPPQHLRNAEHSGKARS